MIKKAMVLAGGNDQIELIKGLRKRFPGIEIMLIDMNPNVRAREYADRMLVISTMDFDKVLDAARKENIDLILSACGDMPMRTMAYVSEQLGLPCYISYEQSLNLTNKVLMKQLMIDGGIPTSKFRKFDVNSNLDIDGLKFPLVIKPADNNGSKGIVKVFSYEGFNYAIQEAKKFTLCGDLLVEEFKDGEELSIEAFINQGKPEIIFASKNIKIKNRNTFTICRNEYISSLPESIEQKIKEIISKIGLVFDIDNIPLLIQLIVNNDDVSVIEFSARTGGGSKLCFMRKMVGVDVIENLIDITMGIKPNINARPSTDNALINYLYANPGVFSSIENLDKMVAEGYIDEVYLYKPYGTKITSSNYSSDRPVGFLIKGDNPEIIKNKMRYINKNIKILDDLGRDIMRHDIFSEE